MRSNFNLEQYRKYFYKTLVFIKQQKILSVIILLSLIMFVSIITISSNGARGKAINSTEHYSKSQSFSQSISPVDTQKVSSNTPLQSQKNSSQKSNTETIINDLQKTGQPIDSSNYLGNNQSGTNVNTQNSTLQQNTNNSSSNGSSNSSGNAGTSQSVSQQDGGQNNFLNNIPTPTPVTDIQIVFTNETGGYFTYVPPAVPPIDVIWMKYINYQDHYAIEYPFDWQMVKTTYNGHEGVTLYMSADVDNIDRPSIAYVGWQVDYLSSSASYTGKIILNGVPGTIYTNGPLGPSSVAAVFQYTNGYFALGSSTSNPIFIYVFDHMLHSLEFNTQ